MYREATENALLQGRPKDGPEDKFRLTPVVPRLSELLGTTVRPARLRACKDGLSQCKWRRRLCCLLLLTIGALCLQTRLPLLPDFSLLLPGSEGG